jgi:hypothetical protein
MLVLAARGETTELSVTSGVRWSSSHHGDGTTKKAGSARGVVDADRGATSEREPSVLPAVESDSG